MSLSIRDGHAGRRDSSESGTGEAAPARKGRGVWLVLFLVVLLLLAGAAYLSYEVLERLEGIEERVTDLSVRATEASELSRRALERAGEAESQARDAAAGRLLAEAESERALEDAEDAREEADTARQSAAEARAEAERIREEAEAELNRLEQALGEIAETRRTALGLVMNLGSDTLNFDFDKANLKPENRELLSRIAGVLMASSQDYTITINGHTDHVGSESYNEGLSERRAEAVREYLVEAGLSSGLMTVKAWGKSQPLVEGRSEAARAKNRRVELGIVNAHVRYGDARGRSRSRDPDPD